MVNLMKSIITAITLSATFMNSAQAFQMACANDSVYLQIKTDQKGDTIKVLTMDGIQLSFLTKIQSFQFETRCGTQLSQSAGLFNNYPIWANGYLSMTQYGEYCGGGSLPLVTAKLHLNLKDSVIDEQLNCKYQF